MWKFDAVQPLDAAAAAEAGAAGQARAVAVERDNQRFVTAARIVGVRRMTEVVLDAFELRAQAELVEGDDSSSSCHLRWKALATRPHCSEAALRHVSGNDAVVGQNPIGERLDERLLHSLVRIDPSPGIGLVRRAAPVLWPAGAAVSFRGVPPHRGNRAPRPGCAGNSSVSSSHRRKG